MGQTVGDGRRRQARHEAILGRLSRLTSGPMNSEGPMPDLVIRPAVQDDLEALWDFLAMAAYEPDAEVAKAVRRVANYLVAWQRPRDLGFIAQQDGEIIRAAWARRSSAEERNFPYGSEG